MWTPNYNDLTGFHSKVKSRQLNPPLSSDERRRFEQSDEECLATIFFRPAGTPRIKESPKAIASDSALKEKLAHVFAIYQIDDHSHVEEFLLKNSFLFQVLIQAVDPINTSFGNTKGIKLRLLEDGASAQLFAVIPTSHEPEDAMERLKEFDSNWWFSAPNEIRDFLEFTLEFA